MLCAGGALTRTGLPLKSIALPTWMPISLDVRSLAITRKRTSAAVGSTPPMPLVTTLTRVRPLSAGACGGAPRSEEHTSELQSRPHLVCRLLLEKKKTPAKSDPPLKKKKKQKIQ